MQEAVTVIEPGGKTYRVFANGRIEGFAERSIIYNRIPMMLLSASVSQHLSSPTSSVMSPVRDGVEQADAPQKPNPAEKMRDAVGEK